MAGCDRVQSSVYSLLPLCGKTPCVYMDRVRWRDHHPLNLQLRLQRPKEEALRVSQISISVIACLRQSVAECIIRYQGHSLSAMPITVCE
jgi:hypothetical protein